MAPRFPEADESAPLRVLALFNHDWSHEFANYGRGVVPSHRLFAMAELRRRGHQVRFLSVGSSRYWRIRQAWWVVRSARSADVVVATHEAAAVPALILKRLGLVRLPVVVLTVAALRATAPHRRVARIIRWALAGAEVLTVYASAQRFPLVDRLGVADDRVRFVRLGVDREFFPPSTERRENTVLAVGTNEGKDYLTLIRALNSDTQCTIVTDLANIEICRPHVAGKKIELLHDVPIDELRSLYRRAGVVVFPLHEVDYSSGQTVLMENASVGSPIIVSDVAGVRDYIPEATRVVASDAVALGRAIESALGSRINQVTYVDVPTVEQMGRSIEEILVALVGGHLAD